MMRLKNEDYALLKCIHWELANCGKEELAARLLNILNRFETARERTREHNRMNAQANREAGYVWKSCTTLKDKQILWKNGGII